MNKWLESYARHYGKLCETQSNKRAKEFVETKNKIDREVCKRISNIEYRSVKID
jgi:hypothetical protein